MSKAGRGAEQISLRLPEGMRDRIKASADAKGRSMNTEIVLRLQNALDRQDDGTISVWLPPDVLERVYHAANEAEIDPNLLILEAVETAYPPKPGVVDLARALADEISAEGFDDTITGKELIELTKRLIAKSMRKHGGGI